MTRPSSRLPASLRAHAHRNFRFYFAGQAVSISSESLAERTVEQSTSLEQTVSAIAALTGKGLGRTVLRVGDGD